MISTEKLRRRISAAQGNSPCDVVFRNVHYLNVFNCQWEKGDVAVADGVIVALDDGLTANRVIDAKGKFLVPGFIDAHVHLESSMMLPDEFQSTVLPLGTTTAICDPHELANVMGVLGIQFFLDSANELTLDLRVMLSSCVPATDFETNGGGHIQAKDLVKLTHHPKALGLAEMMNVPGVLFEDPAVLEKISAFSDRVIDGHCPLVTGRALSAYAASGVSSCHETTQLEEAKEKLRKGISVWIREGSVAKDLNALIPVLDVATSSSVGFCTDDRNPLDIVTEGHLDYLVRSAIAKGVRPEVVYRAVSWTVARHYGLPFTGAIAPGYVADLVLLNDEKVVAIDSVWKHGRVWNESLVKPKIQPARENTIRAKIPEANGFEGPTGNVHVIGVEEGKILTKRSVSDSKARGVSRLSVIERYGKNSKPSNGYATGFGEKFAGSIASSVGHDSHNLIVVGTETRDMQIAVKRVAEMGGGFCIVRDGNVLADLDLGFGGLMSTGGAKHIETRLRNLKKASREVGCELADPFLQLAFLSLPVIPSLKLTDKGLVDVEQFKLIPVSA